jgi:large repetitive protein
LVNTVNGCVYSSPAKAVAVTGTITAAVTSTPPCEDGQPFTLTATTNQTGVTYAWALDGTALTPTTASITNTSNGTYKVDVTKGSCKATAQIPILKSPIPEGLLPDRVVVCNDPDNKDSETNHYDLDPGNFATYNWLKNQLSLSYTGRIYTAISEGEYEVELTNTFGCAAKDKTEVRNECIPKIIAPNAFKPSSSIAPNKEFSVLSFFITDDFEVFIYNRWGEMVYQSNDRYFKWNGGYNNNGGQLLPGGTYAYVIRYVSAFRPDLGKQEQRGGVSLLR